MNHPHHLERTEQTALKSYPCNLCKTPILEGQRYVRHVWLVREGVMRVEKWHEFQDPETDECFRAWAN